MEKLKFVIFSIIFLSLVGFLFYWATNTIQSGSEHQINQKIEKLEDENEDLRKEVVDLKSELSVLQPKVVQENVEELVPEIKEPVAPVVKPTPAPISNNTKNQTLINELQKLVDVNTSLKLGSTGASVGSVQDFLNIYNKTSNKVDNDFGVSTKIAVTSFQKAQGLPGSGEVHKATLTKMIEWLKK